MDFNSTMAMTPTQILVNSKLVPMMIFSNMNTDKTAMLYKNIFEIEFEQSLLAEHTATHLFHVESLNGKKLKIRINNEHSNNEILSYFINKNANITSFNEILPSLNDIFIELVQGTPETRQFQSA